MFRFGAEALAALWKGFMATVIMPPTEPITRRVNIEINDSFCIFHDHFRYCDIRYMNDPLAKSNGDSRFEGFTRKVLFLLASISVRVGNCNVGLLVLLFLIDLKTNLPLSLLGIDVRLMEPGSIFSQLRLRNDQR